MNVPNRRFLINNGEPHPEYNKFGQPKKIKDKFGETRDMYYPDVVDYVLISDEYYVDSEGVKYPVNTVNLETLRKRREEGDPLLYPTKKYEIRVGKICEFTNMIHFQYFWDKYGFLDECDEKGNVIRINKKPIPTAKDRQLMAEKGLTYDNRNNIIPIEDNNINTTQLSDKDNIINQQQRELEELRQKLIDNKINPNQ